MNVSDQKIEEVPLPQARVGRCRLRRFASPLLAVTTPCFPDRWAILASSTDLTIREIE
jgi:hypothetical protein